MELTFALGQFPLLLWILDLEQVYGQGPGISDYQVREPTTQIAGHKNQEPQPAQVIDELRLVGVNLPWHWLLVWLFQAL